MGCIRPSLAPIRENRDAALCSPIVVSHGKISGAAEAFSRGDLYNPLPFLMAEEEKILSAGPFAASIKPRLT